MDFSAALPTLSKRVSPGIVSFVITGIFLFPLLHISVAVLVIIDKNG